MMQHDSNPYAPPLLFDGSRRPPEHHPGRDLIATCIRRGWISRAVLLSGWLDAEIRYEGGGFGERVFVNDQLAARSSAFHTHCVAPRIDFTINCEDCEVAASIEVEVSILHLLQIAKFTLTVDGNVVYSE